MPSASTTASSSVATSSRARVSPAANATDVGGVPASAPSLPLTDTATVNAASDARSSVASNTAGAPSATAPDPASVATGGGTARVTATVYVRVVVPSAAVTVTAISFMPTARSTW